MRSTVFLAVLIGALASSPLAAASAGDTYAPPNPGEPSLAGSVATGACRDDAAYISFDVVLTDGPATDQSAPVSLVLADGANSVTVPLGSLDEGRLQGRVLWPGASVDENGRGNGWPGWEQRGSTWVPTDGGYAWTRGDITATLQANPSLAVPLHYPMSSPDCATAPRGSAAAVAGELPATGSNPAMPLAVAGVGAFAVLAGAGLVVARRRRS